MSLPHNHKLTEILVCIVVAAFVGFLADTASPSVPSPEEALEHILGDRIILDKEALHERFEADKSSLERMYHYGYDTIVTKHSRQAGLDWRLVASLICQESAFQAAAIAARRYHGLMQISSSAAGIFNIKDLRDPDSNVEVGTKYLKYLMDNYMKEGMDSVNAVKFALAAYNCGPGKLQNLRDSAKATGFLTDNWETFADLPINSDWPTGKYVTRILDRYEEFKIITR